ncbi:hypothetical protein PG996_005731 [Apiospora saccharicola]|uniref:HIT domain-containing protein n=1 Tax=Apiospora saccharicola TaxID=335842 RepID=A0ABR1VMF2_9PEZI
MENSSSRVEFDAMYAEERQEASVKLSNEGFSEKDFKGKQTQIKEAFEEFDKFLREHEDAQEDIKLYLTGRSVKEDIRYLGFPKWVDPTNHFAVYLPEDGLVSDDKAIIIGNRQSFDIAQYPGNSSPAGMSMIHLLGLSRQSIYNGVTLTAKNVDIIDDIIKLFKSNWTQPEFRMQVLEHQRNAITVRYDKAPGNGVPQDEADAGHELALKHHKELAERIHYLREEDFQFGLHLYPDQSVPHFHMHIIAMPDDMRQYSCRKHDVKTKDAEEVRDYIRVHRATKSA